ncbi:g3822 [Coccomyxa viridis]|uniref:G3822 protein n=1 Tax=Coccomyxa viridis TaxID=1274662 RepID=A0ABP1FU24_9CHLO
MPKTDNGKRKANAVETAPNAKRQKAANALKTPKKKVPKAKKPSASAATRKPHEADASMQDLPDNVLANVFCALGLDRLRAMQVCKRWQRVGRDPCFTRVVTGESINETISQARPGDTIELKPGFYQEVVLVEKPLKFVGQWSIDPKVNRKYKGVVLQSNRSMAVMCNARVCFDSLVIRTILPGADRSIVGFGPDCSYIALRDCDLDGISGLLVPRTKSKSTTLQLHRCYIHGVAHMAAVTMEGGNLRMEECTLTNCQVGLNVHEGVCVVLKNNDISFNEVGLIFDGYGIIQDNKMWGNLHRSTIDLGKEALARAKEKPPAGDFEQLLAKYHAELAERSTCADIAAPAETGAAIDSTAVAAPDQPGASAPQPGQAAAPAGEAQQDDGVSSHAPVHAATRRTAGPAAPGPPLFLSGNHIQRPQRLRKLSEADQKIRRRVRKLAAEVYGAHEQNGEWNDEGEWHVVGDEDLESSDDDLLGSDIESSSDEDGDDDDDGLDFGDSSGDDWEYDEQGQAWDEAGMPVLMPGYDTEYSDSDSSEEEDSEGGDHSEHSDDSMHTSDFETSQDEDSDDEAAEIEAAQILGQHQPDQAAAAAPAG